LRQKLLNLFLDFLICSDVPMMKISLPIIMVGGGGGGGDIKGLAVDKAEGAHQS
jgi:hypothetical protein